MSRAKAEPPVKLAEVWRCGHVLLAATVDPGAYNGYVRVDLVRKVLEGIGLPNCASRFDKMEAEAMLALASTKGSVKV